MNRRQALQIMGAGFGMVGLAGALQGDAASSPMAPKTPPLPARAKHVIFLFMNGGMSQVDTFDPKPELVKRDGQPMPGPKVQTDRAVGNLMRSPYSFQKCGRSGVEVSEIFPRIGGVIDDVCVIRSMYSDIGNHEPSLYMMNCGHNLPGRPAMGSWITYGLGTENQNLPGFVVMCPGLPVIGPSLWNCGFLPSVYQGTYIPNNEKRVDRLVQYIRNETIAAPEQQRQIDLLTRLDRIHAAATGPQPEIEAGIQAMEVAFRMQTEAPDVFELAKESAATRARYGESDFGRACLMALRLVERGVRTVQVYFGARQPWDSHDDIRDQGKLARVADGPIASLIGDLKSRGLLDETLVVVGSEFGRTPMIENSGADKIGYGRDHNVHGFVTLLAGGGVKGGTAYGATDDFGYKAVEKPVHVHDLHATILYLLGIDHTKLTYRYSGRDFRLTDVYGNVVKEILA
jgi:hypothetical protein